MCVYFSDWGVFRFTNEETRLYIARNVGRYFYARRYRLQRRGCVGDCTLFLGILGVSAFRAKGYRFKAKPVYRFLLGGTAS